MPWVRSMKTRSSPSLQSMFLKMLLVIYVNGELIQELSIIDTFMKTKKFVISWMALVTLMFVIRMRIGSVFIWRLVT